MFRNALVLASRNFMISSQLKNLAFSSSLRVIKTQNILKTPDTLITSVNFYSAKKGKGKLFNK